MTMKILFNAFFSPCDNDTMIESFTFLEVWPRQSNFFFQQWRVSYKSSPPNKRTMVFKIATPQQKDEVIGILIRPNKRTKSF